MDDHTMNAVNRGKQQGPMIISPLLIRSELEPSDDGRAQELTYAEIYRQHHSGPKIHYRRQRTSLQAVCGVATPNAVMITNVDEFRSAHHQGQACQSCYRIFTKEKRNVK